MRCLYCDQPLALLKRLTGDGEFCSKEHRRIYHKEHNQLALARLLAAQPTGAARQHPVNPQKEQQPVAPTPAPAPSGKKGDERQPQCAGFLSDFLREASAVSEAHRLTGDPQFHSGSPVLAEAASESEGRSDVGPRPKAAAFLWETPPIFFAGELRFPGKPALEPLAGRPRLSGEPPSNASIAPRPRPKGAGFVTEQRVPEVRISEPSMRRPVEPRFGPFATTTVSGLPYGRRVLGLPLAAFFAAASIRANTVPGRICNATAEPRWKPLAAVVPSQPTGEINLVLISFLRRSVRMATDDNLPGNFQIRLQPISFPQYGPRMAFLEERLHRTDRIGFTPP